MHYQAASLQKRQIINIAMVVGLGVVGIVVVLLQADPDLLKVQSQTCQLKQPQASITRSQALKLITLKEGVKRGEVLSFMKEPYCQLPPLEVRVGTKSQRDVYPLDSDASIWVVLLYEEDRYLGYRFLTAQKYKVQ